MTCLYELTGLTRPTHERLCDFTKDGSRSPTCPHESMGLTCPTRDPLTSLLGSLGVVKGLAHVTFTNVLESVVENFCRSIRRLSANVCCVLMTPLPLLRRRYLWKPPEGALIKKDLRCVAHVLLPSCLCVQLAFPGCRIKVQHATTTLTVLFAKAGTHSLRSAPPPPPRRFDCRRHPVWPLSSLLIIIYSDSWNGT